LTNREHWFLVILRGKLPSPKSVRDSDKKQSVWQYFQVYLRFLQVFLILKNILGKRVEITRCKLVKNTINNEAIFHLFLTSFGLVILTKF
jgi:hypothetical protein